MGPGTSAERWRRAEAGESGGWRGWALLPCRLSRLRRGLRPRLWRGLCTESATRRGRNRGLGWDRALGRRIPLAIAAILRPILRRLLGGRLGCRLLLLARLTVIRLLPVLAVLPVLSILCVRVVLGPWRRRGDNARLQQKRGNGSECLEYAATQQGPHRPADRETGGRVDDLRDHHQRTQYRDRGDYPRVLFGLRQQAQPGKQRGQHRNRDRGSGVTGTSTGGRTEVGAEDKRWEEVQDVHQQAEQHDHDGQVERKLAFRVIVGERGCRAGVGPGGLRGWISGTTGRVGHDSSCCFAVHPRCTVA